MQSLSDESIVSSDTRIWEKGFYDSTQHVKSELTRVFSKIFSALFFKQPTKSFDKLCSLGISYYITIRVVRKSVLRRQVTFRRVGDKSSHLPVSVCQSADADA